MAFVLADRIKETTQTTGTGAITLGGAQTDFQGFTGNIASGSTTYYAIVNPGKDEWEVGIGTYNGPGNSLSRDAVTSSSNSGLLVNFSAGTKDVFVTQPASQAVTLEPDDAAYVDTLNVIASLGLFGNPIVALAVGAANNDALATQGYVDDNSGGSGTPGGIDTQIQYNNGGAFGGMAGWAWNDTLNELLVTAQAADDTPINVKATASQTANLTEWQNSAGAIRARITNDGGFSNNQGQTDSEAFGAGAAVNNTSATAIGSSASANSVNSIAIGKSAVAQHQSIAIGVGATTTANFQFVVGSGTRYRDFYLGKGVTHSTPEFLIINATGGSGTNIAGASLTLAGGKATGNAVGGSVIIATSAPGASGTTLQSLVTRFTFGISAITISDGYDIVLGTTTGTKIGTATNEKLGFFNAAPVVQPAGTGETVGFTAGAGTGVNDDSTFTGNVGATAYRISDIVKALKQLGFLAQ